MGRTFIFVSVLVFSIGMVAVLGTGCPPPNNDLQKIFANALKKDGCRGCDSCEPEEGEGESPEGEIPLEGETSVEGEEEGEPVEGEGLPAGEGETRIEGEGEFPNEGELVEGEMIEGEGETPEGEVLVEGEGEVFPEGEGEETMEGEGEATIEGEGEVPAEGEGEITVEGEGEFFSLMLGLGAVNPEYIHGTITPDPEATELCPPLEGQPWCGLYPAGTEVYLTPVPNEGYEFDYYEPLAEPQFLT